VDAITIDGLGEEDFRRSIESMLRHGQADTAAARLRALLAPYASGDEDAILPPRFLGVSSADVTIVGWGDLADRIGQHDRPGQRISALSVTVTDTEAAGLGRTAKRGPVIQTSYFSDDAYPFAGAARQDLLEGYLPYGNEWQSNCEGTDTALSVEGIDDLFDAIAGLETRLLESAEPSAREIRAGSLGACYLSVLVHQAVRDAVHRHGLPRALCVMAGSAGAYPYFDAPVVTCEECFDAGIVAPLSIALPPSLADAERADDQEEEDEEEEEADEDEIAERTQSYGSLLSLGATIRTKKPAMMLDAADAAAGSQHYEVGAAHCLTVAGNSDRIGVLPGLGAPVGEPSEDWKEFEVPVELAGAAVWHDPVYTQFDDQSEVCDDAGFPAKSSDIDRYGVSDEAILPEAIRPEAIRPEPMRPEPILPEPFIVQPGGAAPAEPAEPEIQPAREPVAPPVAALSAPASGHSLRTRVIHHRTEPSLTFADRMAAFLRRAQAWIPRR
jgi:hypothetical protein